MSAKHLGSLEGLPDSPPSRASPGLRPQKAPHNYYDAVRRSRPGGRATDKDSKVGWCALDVGLSVYLSVRSSACQQFREILRGPCEEYVSGTEDDEQSTEWEEKRNGTRNASLAPPSRRVRARPEAKPHHLNLLPPEYGAPRPAIPCALFATASSPPSSSYLPPRPAPPTRGCGGAPSICSLSMVRGLWRSAVFQARMDTAPAPKISNSDRSLGLRCISFSSATK